MSDQPCFSKINFQRLISRLTTKSFILQSITIIRHKPNFWGLYTSFTETLFAFLPHCHSSLCSMKQPYSLVFMFWENTVQHEKALFALSQECSGWLLIIYLNMNLYLHDTKVFSRLLLKIFFCSLLHVIL